ncbi:MAG: hypothetical protein WCT41_02465 [Candidatus Paceibacterota bacterium]|jgi:hypothetical protein
MDPELKRELQEMRALVKDNHDMLRSIKRHQWWSFLTTVLFWTAAVIAPLYLYQQYVQPLIARFSDTGTAAGGFQLPTSVDVQKLINSFKSGQ